jgi:hypothetical protein
LTRSPQSPICQELDVRCLIEGHHIGLEAIRYRARLFRRSAVGLTDLDIQAGPRVPLVLERRIDLREQLARYIVGSIQQFDLFRGQGTQRPRAQKSEHPYWPAHHLPRVNCADLARGCDRAVLSMS